MNKYYFLLLFSVSIVSYGQTEIFDLCGGDAYPAGWSATNNVVTKIIEQSDHFLLEAGSPSDVLETEVMDLSEATSLFVDMNFATEGTGADNKVKIEISYNGGSTYTETILTPTPTSTYGPSGDLTLLSTSTEVKLRFSNNGTSGKGVRLQCVTLTAIVSFPIIQVDTPEDGVELPAGTTTTDVVYYTYNVDPSDYVKLTYTIDGDPTVIDLGEVPSGYSFATEDGKGYSLTLTLYDGSDDSELDFEGTNFTVANTLSIAKNEIEGFAVYPNPITNGSFRIMSSKGLSKNVQLYDILGKQVLSKQVQHNETIRVDNLNAGLYILKVEEKGKIATHKIVIK